LILHLMYTLMRVEETPPFRAKLTPHFEQIDPFFWAIFTVIPAN